MVNERVAWRGVADRPPRFMMSFYARLLLRFSFDLFFRVPFDAANVCTHTNPGLSISADDG